MVMYYIRNMVFCSRCGREGHYASTCGHNKSVKGTNLSSGKKDTPKGRCHRCGRPGHWVNNCYARTDIDGRIIDDTDSDDDGWEGEC